MQQDFIFPSESLTEFVTGYLLFEGECNQATKIETLENSSALGLPIGKPFDFFLGGKSIEDESTFIDIFDKPYLFVSHAHFTSLWVSGKIKLVFVVLTEKGQATILNKRKAEFNQSIIPLSRIGVPIFNLMVKRELRFADSIDKGVDIIENELHRFFKVKKSVYFPEKSDFNSESSQ